MALEKKPKIILAEDHVLLRSSLKQLIETSGRMEVTGEAGNGQVLLELLGKKHADIVLLDIEMPVMNGMEALRRITRSYPDIKVVMLSMHTDYETRAEFLTAGARAYIPKDIPEEDFFFILRKVHEHGIHIDEKLAEALVFYKMKENTENGYGCMLSQREVDILTAVAEGLTDIEIAAKLRISRHTVHSHRNNLLKKTRTRNAAELIWYASKNKLIT